VEAFERCGFKDGEVASLSRYGVRPMRGETIFRLSGAIQSAREGSVQNLVATVIAGAALLVSTSASAQSSAQKPSPWSKVFQPNARGRVVVKPTNANACATIAVVPIDPKDDAKIRRQAPTSPQPSTRTQQPLSCQQR